jgi:aspartokinase
MVITDGPSATPIQISNKPNALLNISLPILRRNIVPVVTGFIGAHGLDNYIGWAGVIILRPSWGVPDGSGLVVGDVDMMSADPSESQRKVIPQLSYDEVAELAYFGARICV